MKLRRTSRAQRQLINIISHIADVQHQPIVAGKVLARVEAAEKNLQLFPYVGRKGTRKGTYEYTMHRDPICLIYRITGDTIEVLMVFHMSQNPTRKLD